MCFSKYDQQSTFLTLQENAQKALDDASISLKKAETVYQRGREQLSLLMQYEQEYQAQLATALRIGLSKQSLSNFQLFMANIEKSIEEQKSVLLTMSFKQNQALKTVYQCRKKLNTYKVLYEKKQKIFLLHEARLQQKQIDEFAQQHSARKLAHAH